MGWIMLQLSNGFGRSAQGATLLRLRDRMRWYKQRQ
jgi:hypothetical protein